MIPAALVAELLSIFTCPDEAAEQALRQDLLDVLEPWWTAAEQMMVLLVEEGLPTDARAFEV